MKAWEKQNQDSKNFSTLKMYVIALPLEFGSNRKNERTRKRSVRASKSVDIFSLELGKRRERNYSQQSQSKGHSLVPPLSGLIFSSSSVKIAQPSSVLLPSFSEQTERKKDPVMIGEMWRKEEIRFGRREKSQRKKGEFGKGEKWSVNGRDLLKGRMNRWERLRDSRRSLSLFNRR